MRRARTSEEALQITERSLGGVKLVLGYVEGRHIEEYLDRSVSIASRDHSPCGFGKVLACGGVLAAEVRNNAQVLLRRHDEIVVAQAPS